MDENLILGIHNGSINVEDLTDEQQEQVLQAYQILAEHWAESTKEGYATLGKEILRLVEAANIELDDVNNDDWLH
jgi:cystathionine beta-lyase family protein involved in aluminum resistance